MRKIVWEKGIIRLSTNIDKTTMLDSILHWFRIHLIRIRPSGKKYCRLCNKVIQDEFKKVKKEKI